MAGCYGNCPEDTYWENKLMEQLEKEEKIEYCSACAEELDEDGECKPCLKELDIFS